MSGVAHAGIVTPEAARLLGALCAHWEGKFPVHVEGEAGSITFPSGIVALRACTDTLVVTITSDVANGIEPACQIIADRLTRLADPDRPLAITWTQGPTTGEDE